MSPPLSFSATYHSLSPSNSFTYFPLCCSRRRSCPSGWWYIIWFLAAWSFVRSFPSDKRHAYTLAPKPEQSGAHPIRIPLFPESNIDSHFCWHEHDRPSVCHRRSIVIPTRVWFTTVGMLVTRTHECVLYHILLSHLPSTSILSLVLASTLRNDSSWVVASV